MNKITVIGAGTMGNGIAHLFALNGYNVCLTDQSSDFLLKGMDNIRKNLDRQLKKNQINETQLATTLSNISQVEVTNPEIYNCDLVIEAITENESIKIKLYKELDTHCKPETILASNTSSISITKIGSATGRPDRVIGMHFMNPVPVMKLVEVIRGYATSDSVTKTIMDLSVKIGKVPVEVNDYPGFVSNRILLPMINEAIYTLHEGVAGVTEIDTVMKLGMSHPMGPLQLADFIGLDVCLAILKVLQEGFGNPKYAPCPLLVNMVSAGNLGVKRGAGFYQYVKDSKELIVAERFRKR